MHLEARRFADDDRTILLIGHAGHEEVEGTSGQAPDRTILVQSIEEAERVEVPDPARLSYLTQTTLSVDETNQIVRRPPRADSRRSRALPVRTSATQRRTARTPIKEVAPRADVVLVIGSRNSSNSNRLAEVSRERGTPAYLVDDETEVDPSWLEGAEVVGLTSGASAPERLVTRMLAWLAERGFDRGPRRGARAFSPEESVRFALAAPEVRAQDHDAELVSVLLGLLVVDRDAACSSNGPPEGRGSCLEHDRRGDLPGLAGCRPSGPSARRGRATPDDLADLGETFAEAGRSARVGFDVDVAGVTRMICGVGDPPKPTTPMPIRRARPGAVKVRATPVDRDGARTSTPVAIVGQVGAVDQARGRPTSPTTTTDRRAVAVEVSRFRTWIDRCRDRPAGRRMLPWAEARPARRERTSTEHVDPTPRI